MWVNEMDLVCHVKKMGLMRVIVFLLLGLSSLPAHAYLDPGSGSLIIQSLIGAAAALGVTLKLYWHKIKLKLSGRKAPESEIDPQDAGSNKD